VLLVLDAGVDDFEVAVVGVLEDITVVEVEVDNEGTVVVETVVESVGGGVEVGGGASVDVGGMSSVVLVEFDIVKMRLN
jgi:hypothetical protein